MAGSRACSGDRETPPLLTERQVRIVAAVEDLNDIGEMAPTLRQLCLQVGWEPTSKGSMGRDVQTLIAVGVLERQGRTLRVCKRWQRRSTNGPGVPRENDRSQAPLPSSDATDRKSSVSFLGVPLRYRLTFELEPVGAMHHSDARKAADRVAAAIEQLESDSSELEGIQLVKIVAIRVEECPSAAIGPTAKGRSA